VRLNWNETLLDEHGVEGGRFRDQGSVRRVRGFGVGVWGLESEGGPPGAHGGVRSPLKAEGKGFLSHRFVMVSTPSSCSEA